MRVAIHQEREMRYFARFLFTVASIPTASIAQSTASVTWAPPSGSLVRLTSPVLERRQTATLISADNDSVVVRLKQFANPYALPTTSVTHMEVVHGTHTTKARKAALGFLVVGGITALITAATWEKPSGFSMGSFGQWGDAAVAGAFFGLVGAGVGAIVGMRETDSWQSVPIPRK